jgi:glc operon protein GlcG
MYQTYNLSHADAQKIIAVIQQKVEQEGKGAAIAVADAHGELMAFVRMDGCRLQPGTIAIHKAFTAAREQKESKAVGEESRTQEFPMSNFGDSRFVSWGGGVPVVYQGQVIGGVGVSGLPEEEDMLLARLGASTIG